MRGGGEGRRCAVGPKVGRRVGEEGGICWSGGLAGGRWEEGEILSPEEEEAGSPLAMLGLIFQSTLCGEWNGHVPQVIHQVDVRKRLPVAKTNVHLYRRIREPYPPPVAPPPSL